MVISLEDRGFCGKPSVLKGYYHRTLCPRVILPWNPVSGSGLRRRIELIQDFTMPVAATGIDVSADGQYIFATGIYKPRVRCYDVSHLSMKFERCIDAEVVGLALLSENYTKVTGGEGRGGGVAKRN